MPIYLIKRKNNRGFTLIEVVIALSIFAVMGLVSFQIVNGLSTARQVISERSDISRSLLKTLRIMEQDLEQTVVRPVYDTDGSSERLKPLIGDGDTYLLEFTRQGVRNPLLLKRPGLQRVAYGLVKDIDGIRASNQEQLEEFYQQEEKNFEQNDILLLVRFVWPSLDRADESIPYAQILFDDVVELEIEYLNHDSGGQDWMDYWPPFGSQERPYAVKMKFELLNYGNFERLFFVRDLPPPAT